MKQSACNRLRHKRMPPLTQSGGASRFKDKAGAVVPGEMIFIRRPRQPLHPIAVPPGSELEGMGFLLKSNVLPVLLVTGTATVTDEYNIILATLSAAATLNIPAAADVLEGFYYQITRQDNVAASLTITPSTGTINGTSSYALGASDFTQLVALPSTNDWVLAPAPVSGSTPPLPNGNTALGTEALNSLTSGPYNTGVGYQAGFAVTSGNSNTALGTQSLYAETTGSQNTAVGAGALQSQDGVSGSTAVGSGALEFNITGNYNTAVGYGAAEAVNTDENTAVGYKAMASVSSGSSNTALGANAMLGATSSAESDSVAIGDSALYSTNGSANTAVGYHALYGNSTGTNNTAVGNQAISGATTGTYNVAVGDSAGMALAVATSNTTVGASSMLYVASGTGNVAVGESALSITAATSYSVAIGYQAMGVSNTQSSSMGTYNVAVGAGSLGVVTTGANNTAIGKQAGAAITTGSASCFLGDMSGKNIATSSGTISIGPVTGGTGDYADSIYIGNLALANPTGAADGNNVIIMGTAVTQGAYIHVPWMADSDAELKKNIQDHPLGLKFINALRPCSYHFKEENDARNYRSGFLAQEIETAALRLGLDAQKHGIISKGDKGWGMSTTGLFAPLVKAVQELSAEVTELRAKLALPKKEAQ